MNFFTSEKLTSSITMITDLTKVHMFLVEGKERAVLIDTGDGIGNIKKYVESITNLPLTVILTHGHVDHASGSVNFDKVYINKNDFELVKHHCSMENKRGFAQFSMGEMYSALSDDDFVKGSQPQYLPLNDGDTFDLGGVSVKAIAVPGHTQGMTCMLIPEERIMILGDGCNNCTFLFDEEASTVADYKKSLLNLKKYEDQYDTVFNSHGSDYNAGKDVLDNVIELCDVIMNGQADQAEFDFLGYKAYLARRYRADGRNREGKVGNIVYSLDKII